MVVLARAGLVGVRSSGMEREEAVPASSAILETALGARMQVASAPPSSAPCAGRSSMAWVNGAGQVATKSATGPYGEELGLFTEPKYSSIAFAGLASGPFPEGISYTPNRYLGNLTGRFLSVDPSGSFNPRDPRTLNQYAYVAGNPLTYTDPLGLFTYLIIVGRSYLAPELKGKEFDVGGLFEAAAETRKREIEKDVNFIADRDKVEMTQAGTHDEFIRALNKKYERGSIREIDVFSHGSLTGTAINLGEGSLHNPIKWVQMDTVRQLAPDLLPDAIIRLYGCNAAYGNNSIAQMFADYLQVTVAGPTTTTRFDNTSPSASHPDVHMIPDAGGQVVLLNPRGTAVVVKPGGGL